MTDIATRIAELPPEKRALLEEKLALARQRRAASKTPIARVDSAPVPSFGQERLWFLEQIEGGTPLYNISVAIHLKGHLDIDAVKSALNAIIQRHDSLRTRYLSDQGVLRLVVEEDVSIDLPFADLGALPETERMIVLDDRLEAEARHVMRLDRDLLMRAALFRVAENDHTLQLTLHHIASDGWSLGILYREFAAYYNEAVTGQEANIAELPIRYSDYASWLRQTLQGPELERLTSYWNKELSGSSHALQLPTDRPRPASQTFIGKQQRFLFPAETADAVRRFSRQQDLTPFMVLLASLYVVLSRYSGQSDILVGSPIAARPTAQVEDIVGFFTNTLALRGNLGDEPTFRDLVRRVKRTTLDAFDHQNVPFEKVIELLNPERDLSRSPLFQVMFILQNTPVQRLELQGLSADVRGIHTGTAKFDMTVEVEEVSDDLMVLIEYNTFLFNSETIDRFWTHYKTFLQNAIVRPEESVASIPMLTEVERQRILVDWNATEMEYPRDVSLARLIEDQVERTPDAIAVVYGEERVSYRELNERANKLAHELIKHGAGPDKLIGICVERSSEMLVALVAIVKSGAAYVPLDPAFPQARLGAMIEDAELELIVTDARAENSISSFHGTRLYCRDAAWDSNRVGNPGVEVDSENLAYVIYTSGTTGKPKGVEVTRGAFINFLASVKKVPGITETDRLVAVTTISFDIAGLELFLPLVSGACVVLASRETAIDGRALRGLIEETQATILQATPTTWRLLFEAGWQGNGTLTALCGGEAMPPELVEPLTSACRSVWNMYGPTETTVWSSLYQLKESDKPVLIGRPIANTSMYVLDDHLQPVPPGVAGELYIAGDGVARGYRNRPELTAEKFVADPFRAGQRMYRTGDLARFHGDGNIECLGRTDHQVKIRGFRIELGEIESLLKQYPGVDQAVVVAREDVPGDKRLVGYIVAGQHGSDKESDKASISAADLRSYLKESLPEYMVPAAFVSLERIPLNANGKIDRKALPAPDENTIGVRTKKILPRTYVEKQLSEIWEEIFAISEVSVDDDFFDLGGHSLLALRTMAKITQVFGKQLPLNTLFESPTIAKLAKYIESDQKTVGRHTLVSIQASGSRPPIFWIPGGAALGLFRLRNIVTRLGPDQPVYGLGSGVPDSLDEIEGVEERAANYLKLIRTVQQHGPYCIAGFCAGGRVAYEIAQQLTVEGEPVAFLCLINCGFPNYPAGRLNTLRVKAQRMRHQIRTARANGGTFVGYFRAKVAERRAASFERQKRKIAKADVAQHGFQQANSSQNEVLLEATIEKFERYRPQPYPGRVSLFISNDEFGAGVNTDLDSRFAWRKYAAEHEVRLFPGGHEVALDMPYAIDFAETLQAALTDALNRYDSTGRRDES